MRLDGNHRDVSKGRIVPQDPDDFVSSVDQSQFESHSWREGQSGFGGRRECHPIPILS